MDDVINPFADPSVLAIKPDDVVKAQADLDKQDAQIKSDAEVALSTPTKESVKMIAVEGPKYNGKLRRIESILRRAGLQPISGMLRDIDTVIKE